MADRGILFSLPMVSAILAGRKTQTRRLLQPCPWPEDVEPPYVAPYPEGARAVWCDSFDCSIHLAAPFAVGDRLYVRESYYQRGHWAPVEGQRSKGGRQKWAFVPADGVVTFDPPAEFRLGRHHKDPETVAWHKRLGRFMPRAYSRITLTVTEVRVQRLQDCSEGDALAEGIYFDTIGFTAGPMGGIGGCNQEWSANPKIAYANLWRLLHSKPGETWTENPWIVVVSFSVELRNIDVGPSHA